MIPSERLDVRQTAIRLMRLAGKGNSSFGVCDAIIDLVQTQGGWTEAEDWLKRRGFPEEDKDNSRVDWWDQNIEKFFEHNPGGEPGLKLKANVRD